MRIETEDLDLTPNAFDRLLLVLSNLSSYGIETAIRDGSDPTAEISEIQGDLKSRYPGSTGCCLLVMKDDLASFTPEGEMKRPLLVHQRGVGVIDAARAAFRQFDLDIRVLDDEGRLLVVSDELPAPGPELSRPDFVSHGGRT